MKSYNLLIIVYLSLLSCQKKKIDKVVSSKEIPLKYAKGFSIEKYNNHTKLTVHKPFKGASKPLTYLLIKDTIITSNDINTTILKLPINKYAATSTTQIPVFEELEVLDKLKGYTNTKFISSPKARTLIDNGEITELGHEQNINFEKTLLIQPEAFFSFAVNDLNKTSKAIKKAGIPLVIDASWLEETPLGRAEWVKFFSYFFEKETLANQVFKNIEQNYQEALNQTKNISKRPTIMYGSMYNGQWYTPAGESYIAQILNEAKTQYFWKASKGTGSLSLNFEKVFITAKDADYWFSPGYSKNLKELEKQNQHYAKFKPFLNKSIYTYSNTVGRTGGLLFFELGALRPDLILKDIIKITHPNSLPEYKTTFFKKLE